MNFITEYDLSLFEVDDACPLCGERLEITDNIVFCGCCGCGKDRREISRRLATEVMGWHLDNHAWYKDDKWTGYTIQTWTPWENIVQAMMVRDKIVEDYSDIRQIFADCLDRTVLGRTILHFTAKDICLAALEAIGGRR